MVSQDKYSQMTKKASPNSKCFKNIVLAFFIGGAICTLGQAFFFLYGDLCGLAKEETALLTSSTLVLLSAILTGLGIYDNIAKYAGAGTLVPITGFANAMVSSSLEFKTEGMIMGIGAKMFNIAGPVIVYGIVVSAVYGLIYYISTMM